MECTYRIMEIEGEEDKYGLFEFYKMEDGKTTWTETADLYDDDLVTMRWEVEMMLQAFDMPILSYETGLQVNSGGADIGGSDERHANIR